ncbi:MAG: CinA family protein [Nitrospirae bacterium]|nr:CinA family protein [Nitrospirota bacterium]
MNYETFSVVKRVHEIFKQKGITLSVAESCTGGLISHVITSTPGASAFFNAGVVSYSADAKKDILRVSPEIIQHSGIISDEMACEMAERIRIIAKADYSLATTGNLGPDAQEGKETGLVYVAVSKEGKTLSHTLHLSGDRRMNKEEASLAALRFLIDFVNDK